MIRAHRAALPAGAAALALALAACGDTGTTTPPDDSPAQLTVDASAGWAFVRLGSQAQLVTVADPSSSQAWDIAFNATTVMLNGGTAGPAGVAAYCVCQNQEPTGDQVKAMTAATELADFQGVTASAAPADASVWKADSLAEAVTGWYRYDLATHVVSAAPDRAWKLRLAARAGADTAYARFHVTAIENPTREHAGRVTFEYAVQPKRGAAMGPTRAATVDLSAGAATYDLVAGAPASGQGWDLRLDGYTLRLNGGASGSGNAGAAAATGGFASIHDASDLVPQQYLRDGSAGAFTARPWYLYNVTGSDHQVWPTFQVYLVRRGTELYKLQITGYYDAAGSPRHITFRYARLAG